MCGLIGSSGQVQARYLIALGCLSEKRGDDSAGVGWQVPGGKLRITKVAQNPLVAFPVTLAPAIRHAARYGGPLIGHTRLATTGAVSGENAHPFLDKEAQIAWAHNGVITNHKTFGTYEVDSQSLIVGIKQKSFKAYNGPIALLWIEDGKLRAFRKGNPLYRGFRRDAVYLASEQRMLAEIGCRKIKELSEGRIYTWHGSKLVSVQSVPANTPYRYTSAKSYYDEGFEKDFPRWDEKRQCWSDEACGGEKKASVLALVSPEDPDAEPAVLESLCIECYKNPKGFMRDYCQSCYNAFVATRYDPR